MKFTIKSSLKPQSCAEFVESLPNGAVFGNRDDAYLKLAFNAGVVDLKTNCLILDPKHYFSGGSNVLLWYKSSHLEVMG